jgi:hypothetical protein
LKENFGHYLVRRGQNGVDVGVEIGLQGLSFHFERTKEVFESGYPRIEYGCEWLLDHLQHL